MGQKPSEGQPVGSYKLREPRGSLMQGPLGIYLTRVLFLGLLVCGFRADSNLKLMAHICIDLMRVDFGYLWNASPGARSTALNLGSRSEYND